MTTKMMILALALSISGAAFAGNESSGGRLGASAVAVQFNSFGEGIDHQSQYDVLGLIAREEAKGRVSRKLAARWGREGEISYCFEFTSPQERLQGILKIQRIIRDNTQGMRYGWTTTQVQGGCDPATFGPFSGDDRSLEVYGDEAIIED